MNSAYQRRDSPEHLEWRIQVGMPLRRSRNVVDPLHGRNGRKLGKLRGRRFRAFLNTKKRWRNFFCRSVIGDCDDCAGSNRRIVVQSKSANSFDEICNRTLVEGLDRGADLGDIICLGHKFCDHPKIVGTTFQGPKEILIRSRVGDNLSAVTQDHIIAHDVVHGISVFVGEVVHSTNQGET